MKKLLILLVVGLAFSGFTMITIYGNWQIAAGIFLLMWADNIDKDKNSKT